MERPAVRRSRSWPGRRRPLSDGGCAVLSGARVVTNRSKVKPPRGVGPWPECTGKSRPRGSPSAGLRLQVAACSRALRKLRWRPGSVAARVYVTLASRAFWGRNSGGPPNRGRGPLPLRRDWDPHSDNRRGRKESPALHSHQAGAPRTIARRCRVSITKPSVPWYALRIGFFETTAPR